MILSPWICVLHHRDEFTIKPAIQYISHGLFTDYGNLPSSKRTDADSALCLCEYDHPGRAATSLMVHLSGAFHRYPGKAS